MRRIPSFIMMLLVKWLATVFYHFKVSWLQGSALATKHQWQQINFIVFLNHTSLFEPLFLRLAPVGFLWRLSGKLVVPGADITLKRPLAGRLLRAIVPGCIAITRNRDDSWQYFLTQVQEHKINAILPEGRMKRRDGLDKHGQAMTIRGGVADMLAQLNQGTMLLVISGGLHHIQAPGDKLPKLFKTIEAKLGFVDIAQYKQQLNAKNSKQFKQLVVADLQQKLEQYSSG